MRRCRSISTVAFAGPRFVLSSTEGLARQLATAPNRAAAQGDAAAANTTALLDFAPLRRVLADNRAHLVTQNMLKEGHTRDEAERHISLFLAFLGYLKDVQASLTNSGEALHLDLQFRLQDDLGGDLP